MKTLLKVSLLVLAIVMATGTEAKAQNQKEFNSSGTWPYTGTFKMLPVGPDRLQMNYEIIGMGISDTRGDPFHNMSYRCIGGGLAVKGEVDHSGSCVGMSLTGDQVFWTYKAAGRLGGPGRGTSSFIGGTGKFAGIQGNMTYEEINLRPIAEGTIQGYTKSKGQYKLP
jgi:hypothetical protein